MAGLLYFACFWCCMYAHWWISQCWREKSKGVGSLGFCGFCHLWEDKNKDFMPFWLIWVLVIRSLKCNEIFITAHISNPSVQNFLQLQSPTFFLFKYCSGCCKVPEISSSFPFLSLGILVSKVWSITFMADPEGLSQYICSILFETSIWPTWKSQVCGCITSIWPTWKSQICVCFKIMTIYLIRTLHLSNIGFGYRIASKFSRPNLLAPLVLPSVGGQEQGFHAL